MLTQFDISHYSSCTYYFYLVSIYFQFSSTSLATFIIHSLATSLRTPCSFFQRLKHSFFSFSFSEAVLNKRKLKPDEGKQQQQQSREQIC